MCKSYYFSRIKFRGKKEFGKGLYLSIYTVFKGFFCIRQKVNIARTEISTRRIDRKNNCELVFEKRISEFPNNFQGN